MHCLIFLSRSSDWNWFLVTSHRIQSGTRWRHNQLFMVPFQLKRWRRGVWIESAAEAVARITAGERDTFLLGWKSSPLSAWRRHGKASSLPHRRKRWRHQTPVPTALTLAARKGSQVLRTKLWVHPEIDDRIAAGVGHSEPMDPKKELKVSVIGNVIEHLRNISKNVVNVEWQPGECVRGDAGYHHFYRLQKKGVAN